jgi:hypothetical protein
LGSGYFNLWEREKVKGGTVLDYIRITGFIWVLIDGFSLGPSQGAPVAENFGLGG